MTYRALAAVQRSTWASSSSAMRAPALCAWPSASSARIDATAAHPAATIDLLRHAGVAIVPRADGLAITLDAKALADLRPRARLQFVDRWR